MDHGGRRHGQRHDALIGGWCRQAAGRPRKARIEDDPRHEVREPSRVGVGEDAKGILQVLNLPPAVVAGPPRIPAGVRWDGGILACQRLKMARTQPGVSLVLLTPSQGPDPLGDLRVPRLPRQISLEPALEPV